MNIKKMTLIGGDWDGLTMEDSGTTMIRMGVASDWENDRPKVGAMVSEAIYQPAPDRKTATFIGYGEWGICGGVVEAEAPDSANWWKGASNE